MQVTHVNDSVTHAVISNQKTTDFGISNSAEFFNILSNTLYSNKILAVVREVLCNAWDIHIHSGRTALPVEVELTRTKLTIRDFGTGISDDDMHPIYAVYGNSTKKLDGQQTGGFGLGSKAPFAYTDHFEVTSYHNGKKTIYAISKSSAEIGGKPGITPIVCVPCGTETGLSVSLAIDPMDYTKFNNTIMQIAMFGEMNVKLNGDGVKTIPFSQAAHGFVAFSQKINFLENINIRYGNVVYPIPQEDHYHREYQKIKDLFTKIFGRGYYGSSEGSVVFQAKPNTISVTPSRESLSMTDSTKETIKELLVDFLKLTESELFDECVKYNAESVVQSYKAGLQDTLIDSNNNQLMLFKTKPEKTPNQIFNMQTLSKAYMNNKYPHFTKFERIDTEQRLKTLLDNNYGGTKNKGRIQSYIQYYKALCTQPTLKEQVHGVEWFNRYVVQPITRNISKHENVDPKKLFVYGNHTDRSVDKNGRRKFWDNRKTFVEPTKLSPRSLRGYMPFLRNIVVISFNRDSVVERLPNFPRFGTTESSEFFVYITPRTDKKIDDVRKYFIDLGMDVIDLTIRHAHEPELVPIVKEPKKVVKPRKKGVPQLSAIQAPDNRLMYADALKEDIKRIETPEYIVQFNPRAQSARIFRELDVGVERSFVRAYGHLGGIVVNDNQYNRFTKELGIPSAKEWMAAKIQSEIETNPRLQLLLQVFCNDPVQEVQFLDYYRKKLLQTIMLCPELCLEFGILNEMTPEDRNVLTIIQTIQNTYDFRYNHSYRDLAKLLEKRPLSTEVTTLCQKLQDSKLFNALDPDEYEKVFNDLTATPAKKKLRPGMIDMLIYALDN